MDAAVLLSAVAALASPAAPVQPPGPEVPSGPARTVGAAIRHAHLTGAVAWRQRSAWERDLAAARRAARRLPPARAHQVQDALAVADDLAAAGRLGPERLVPVMAGIRATAWTFRRPAFPLPAARLRIPGDGLVYQYRPGYGVQPHPLASAGRLNALATACLHRRSARCRRAELGRTARDLLEVGVRDRSRLRFEYTFGFAGGRVPWSSAMAQATAAQALARAARVTGGRAGRRAATAAYRALVSGETVVRTGGRVRRFVMYSFQPQMRVLNGELQTLVGLGDYARLSGSRQARRVARRAARALAADLPAWDTGAWTLYAAGGREATLHYHGLAALFAGRACRRGVGGAFCLAARRYARYTREPPQLDLRAAPAARAGRLIRVTVRASKHASGSLVVRRGRVAVLRQPLELRRVPATVAFRPARAGRYGLQLAGMGLNGRRATARATVRVRPRPEPARREREAGPDRRGTPRPNRSGDPRTTAPRSPGTARDRRARPPKTAAGDQTGPPTAQAPGDAAPERRGRRPKTGDGAQTRRPTATAPDDAGRDRGARRPRTADTHRQQGAAPPRTGDAGAAAHPPAATAPADGTAPPGS